MTSGRYAKYYKSRYAHDDTFRAQVLARNQRYVSEKMQEDEGKFRQSRAEASKRSYDKKRDEIRRMVENLKASNVSLSDAVKTSVAAS